MKNEVPAKFDDRNDPQGVTRRRFFMGLGLGSLAATASGGAVVFMQYLEPNVLFEPPTKHVVGAPEDYPVSSVVSHPDIRVYVVRTEAGFFALSAVCTHLGCITRWNEQAGQIQCPCHGSRFDSSGRVLAGPAPRPLDHLLITLEDDGRLVVDVANIVDPDYVLRI